MFLGNGEIIAAGFFFAALSASFGMPFQSLMYLLAVIYAAHDINSFLALTVIFFISFLFGSFYRATKR